jgi:hypothetical protein
MRCEQWMCARHSHRLPMRLQCRHSVQAACSALAPLVSGKLRVATARRLWYIPCLYRHQWSVLCLALNGCVLGCMLCPLLQALSCSCRRCGVSHVDAECLHSASRRCHMQ